VVNLILLLEEDFVGAQRVRVRGRRLAHVTAVHRARAGDRLRVGRLNGLLGTGVITQLTSALLEMEVCLDHPPPPALPVTLLLALPRPKSLKKVLQAATAMGVKRVVLMNTWRVEKSFWSSPVLEEDGLREPMLLGLEQAGDTILPRVTVQRLFRPFVEDVVPQLIGGSRALVAHPAAESPCPHDVQGAVTLAVGPEGGFTVYELERFRTCGFAAVALGPRPLRVEHAVPALLGRLF
jgi:16S rRNA (uracil1498-N3)-methyltransferase